MSEWSVSGNFGVGRNQGLGLKWLGCGVLSLWLGSSCMGASCAAAPLYPGSVLPAPKIADPFGEERGDPAQKPVVTPPALDGIDDPTSQSLSERKRILDAAKQALQAKMRDFHLSSDALAKDQPPREMIDKDAAGRLVGIYQAMPPRQAAAIFDVMDTHILVGIASQMDTRHLSAIMANMSPDRVNLISQFLVGVRTFPSHSGSSSEKAFPKKGQMPQIAPLIPSRQ
ncbi:MotE family protein [Acetobacter malorum]|uniref:MotE family protein n=1 Tax=Acetobacter malorum TaxID=178901 RepID=UPI000B268988|nr:hypothetical protein [Acetobacter malorum]